MNQHHITEEQIYNMTDEEYKEFYLVNEVCERLATFAFFRDHSITHTKKIAEEIVAMVRGRK